MSAGRPVAPSGVTDESGSTPDSRLEITQGKSPTAVPLYFAIFRGRPEGLPTQIERILQGPAFGTNWTLAQRLHGVRNWRVWAIPGPVFLCLLIQKTDAIGQSCTRTDRAVRKGMFDASIFDASKTRPQGARVVVGLVPDGVSDVRVSASAPAVAVIENTFIVRDAVLKPPERLIFEH